jgi:hypothetical protein
LAKHQTRQLKEYIYPGTSITAYTNSNLVAPIKAEILMQLHETNGFENIILAPNEVAVSRNISIKLNIGLNDSLLIDTGYKNMDKYVISHIIDYSHGTFFDPFSDWGLIIMGNDISFMNSINVRYICFSDIPLQELNTFVLNSINDINEIIIIKDIKLYFILVLFKYFLLFISLSVIIYLIIKRVYDSYWERYLSWLLQLGLSSISIISIIFTLSLLKIFIPLLIGYLINIFINTSIKISHVATFSITIVCIFLSFTWHIMCYEIISKRGRFKYG